MRKAKLALISGLLLVGGLFAQNLLKNPSFEEVNPNGSAKYWQGSTAVYKVSEEYALTGKRSLYYKNDDEKRYEVCFQSIADIVDRHSIYKFGIRAKTRNVKGDGPTVCVEYWNGDKYLGGVYPSGLKSTSGEWEIAEDTFGNIPAKATKINIVVYCREHTTGEVWFDDVFLEPFKEPFLSVHTTDAYRNVIDASRDMNVYAMICPGNKVRPENAPGLKLVVMDKSGKEIMVVRPLPHDETGVRFTVQTTQLAPGEYSYRIEAEKGGKLEAVEGTFTRVDAYPKRKAYIDDHRRLIVDGKPFFPLGLYFSHIAEDYQIFKDSAFNCLMSYNAISRKDLDMLKQDGISVIYSVKDNYPNHIGIRTQAEADERTVKTVSSLKDHPAIIAWYINDEMPLAMLDTLKARRDLMEKLDPDRPTWVCLNRYGDTRYFLPSYDVIGTDPYPITTVSKPAFALECSRLATEGPFGVRANWMVPQVFNWSAYWTKYGKDVEEILNCKAPTFEEMKSMTWMCIAGGATGLIYYSWFDLFRMAKERDYRNVKLPADDFDKRWGEIKRMASEVRQHEDILLSIDKALEMKAVNIPEEIGMRTFGKGDETWVLLVNSNKDQKTACAFDAPGDVACRGVTLGKAKPTINGKSVKITLKPLESVFLRLVRK